MNEHYKEVIIDLTINALIAIIIACAIFQLVGCESKPDCDHTGCIKREAKLRQLIDSTHKDCAWLAK